MGRKKNWTGRACDEFKPLPTGGIRRGVTLQEDPLDAKRPKPEMSIRARSDGSEYLVVHFPGGTERELTNLDITKVGVGKPPVQFPVGKGAICSLHPWGMGVPVGMKPLPPASPDEVVVVLDFGFGGWRLSPAELEERRATTLSTPKQVKTGVKIRLTPLR